MEDKLEQILQRLEKLDTLEERLDKLEKLDKLEDDMAEIQQSITGIQSASTQQAEQLKQIEDQVKDIENGTEFLEHEVEDLKSADEKKQEEIDDLKRALKQNQLEARALRRRNSDLMKYAVELETYSRRENLVFEGIEEKEKENTWENIVTVMKNHMKLDNIQDIKIQRCHRIGKPNQAAKKPRPIIVRFLCYPDRMRVWANRRNLKGTNIFLNEDLPKSVQSTRRTLRPYLKIAQKSDQHATIRNDKLLYKGKYYDLHEIPRDILWQSDSGPFTKKINNYICFGGRSSIFSNFFPAPLEIDGTQFNCNEQFYQFQKALDAGQERKASAILATVDPVEQKKIGDSCKNDKAWYTEHGLTVMRHGITEKFRQNPSLYHVLQEVSKCCFVECNVHDKYWGNGLALNNDANKDVVSWEGKNMLGQCYEKVCQELFT